MKKAWLLFVSLGWVGCTGESLVGLERSVEQAAQTADYCAQLPRLTQAPSIDGQPDVGAALTQLPRDTWRDPQNPMPLELSAEYAAAWHDEGIYLFVHVVQPEVRPSESGALWCGDAVHLFVDADGQFDNSPDYDAVGTLQFIIAAPSGTTPNLDRATAIDSAGGSRDWQSSRFGAFPQDDGYSVEAVVTADDLGQTINLNSGQRSGHTVSVSFSGVRSVPNAEDALCEGFRLGDIALALGSGECISPHCNVEAFCTPVLGD